MKQSNDTRWSKPFDLCLLSSGMCRKLCAISYLHWVKKVGKRHYEPVGLISEKYVEQRKFQDARYY